MQKYRLEIMYKGGAYHGWQRQPEHPSVQQELEEALSAIIKEDCKVHGCGRTDAGVHASQYFLDFTVAAPIEFDLCFRLNKLLSGNISAVELTTISAKANAQLDAQLRTYEYHLHFKKHPFLQDISAWYTDEGLNVEKLSSLAELIQGELDFRSFCKRPELYKHTRCTVEQCHWKKTDHGLVLTIQANRFVQGMVRLLVGTQLEVAYGRRSEAEFRSYLFEQVPMRFYKYAYPQGLRLSQVLY